jgi:hypothetical protein
MRRSYVDRGAVTSRSCKRTSRLSRSTRPQLLSALDSSRSSTRQVGVRALRSLAHEGRVRLAICADDPAAQQTPRLGTARQTAICSLLNRAPVFNTGQTTSASRLKVYEHGMNWEQLRPRSQAPSSCSAARSLASRAMPAASGREVPRPGSRSPWSPPVRAWSRVARSPRARGDQADSAGRDHSKPVSDVWTVTSSAMYGVGVVLRRRRGALSSA